MASIPFDKLGGKLWYNGEMVDWDEGRLHILSHGLHYGSCVFEGEPFFGQDRLADLLWRLEQRGLAER